MDCAVKGYGTSSRELASFGRCLLSSRTWQLLLGRPKDDQSELVGVWPGLLVVCHLDKLVLWP